MFWSNVSSVEDLEKIKEASFSSEPLFIFKHSTRCAISSMAYSRLKNIKEKQLPQATVYYLDVLKHRSISNEVSIQWKVKHQSPQLLKIEKGLCTAHASHNAINKDLLLKTHD
jgi:bacillithiol system protein YtxJ